MITPNLVIGLILLGVIIFLICFTTDYALRTEPPSYSKGIGIGIMTITLIILICSCWSLLESWDDPDFVLYYHMGKWD